MLTTPDNLLFFHLLVDDLQDKLLSFLIADIQLPPEQRFSSLASYPSSLVGMMSDSIEIPTSLAALGQRFPLCPLPAACEKKVLQKDLNYFVPFLKNLF